ncbi:hypothetical protein [Nitrosomonas aestuarii]|uniref:hypothetical protein n=1 Tax=Nitrosomonas aestuarii TaxID=52441 RepID=UPI000B86B80D|nr:hypothetical protein [Nitrosomonas aestuarii]
MAMKFDQGKTVVNSGDGMDTSPPRGTRCKSASNIFQCQCQRLPCKKLSIKDNDNVIKIKLKNLIAIF